MPLNEFRPETEVDITVRSQDPVVVNKTQDFQQQPLTQSSSNSNSNWNSLQVERDQPLQSGSSAQHVPPIMPTDMQQQEKTHKKKSMKQKIKGTVKTIKHKLHLGHESTETGADAQAPRERTDSVSSSSSESSDEAEGYDHTHPLPADQITSEHHSTVAEDAAKAARKQGLAKGPSTGEKIKKKLHMNKPAREQVEGQKRRDSASSSSSSDEDEARRPDVLEPHNRAVNTAPIAAVPETGKYNTEQNSQAQWPGQGQIHEIAKNREPIARNLVEAPGYETKPPAPIESAFVSSHTGQPLGSSNLDSRAVASNYDNGMSNSQAVAASQPRDWNSNITSAKSSHESGHISPAKSSHESGNISPAKSSHESGHISPAKSSHDSSAVITGNDHEFRHVDPLKVDRQLPSFIPSETLVEPTPIDRAFIKANEAAPESRDVIVPVAFFVPLETTPVDRSLERSFPEETEDTLFQRVRSTIMGESNPNAPTMGERADDVLQRVKTLVSTPFATSQSADTVSMAAPQNTVLQRIRNMINARFASTETPQETLYPTNTYNDATLYSDDFDIQTYRAEPAESFLARLRTTVANALTSIQTSVVASIPSKEAVQGALNTSRDMAASTYNTVAASMPSKEAVQGALNTSRDMAASTFNTVAASMPSKEAVQGALITSRDVAANTFNTVAASLPSKEAVQGALTTSRDVAANTFTSISETVKEKLPSSAPATNDTVLLETSAAPVPQESFFQKVKNFVEPYIHPHGEAVVPAAGVETETVRDWKLQSDQGIPQLQSGLVDVSSIDQSYAIPQLQTATTVAPNIESGVDRSHVILPSQVQEFEASSGVDRSHVILPSQIQELETRAGFNDNQPTGQFNNQPFSQ